MKTGFVNYSKRPFYADCISSIEFLLNPTNRMNVDSMCLMSEKHQSDQTSVDTSSIKLKT